jgi:hypothetical protein
MCPIETIAQKHSTKNPNDKLLVGNPSKKKKKKKKQPTKPRHQPHQVGQTALFATSFTSEHSWVQLQLLLRYC